MSAPGVAPYSATGSDALAWGALEAGVQFVTGYPGSPATAPVESLLRLSGPETWVEWAINEKSAVDSAIGASVAGVRVLLAVKSVGLNVALDSLMVANLAPGDGGLVILVGDDPGGWGSQNEEDSRPLAAALEVPLLEPATVPEARDMMRYAFKLAEEAGLPVVVRVTRALVAGRAPIPAPQPVPPVNRAAGFRRQRDRWTALPIQVVDQHRRLQAALDGVQALFESSAFNAEQGGGPLGVIVSGYVYQKLAEALPSGLPGVRLLRLATLNPLPERRIAAFLRQVQAVLVLEEVAPYVETGVQATAQRAGLTVPVYGRRSGHLPGAGEVFGPQLAGALARFLPGWQAPPAAETGSRTMPSRQSLCDGCPYIPTFDALLAAMSRHGGREAFVVTGETGCLVRSQLPPWELLDVKYSMGSSIGLAAGLARAGVPQRAVAVSGDSAFLHNGLGELIDAAQAGLPLLVVLLDNGTTALSGGQPHPGTARDARGLPRRPVDLAALVRAAGVDRPQVVAPEDCAAAFDAALGGGELSVVIVRGPCAVHPGQPGASD